MGRRGLQKKHKRKGWLLQSRVQREGSWPFHKMRSMDSTGEKHIVLCIYFQYPAPKVSQAEDLRSGLGLPSASQTWGSPKLVPLQGPPPTALCSASSHKPILLSLCSNSPKPWDVGFPGSTEKGASYPSLPSLYNLPILPPGSSVKFREKHNLNRVVVLSEECPSGLSLKRHKYT